LQEDFQASVALSYRRDEPDESSKLFNLRYGIVRHIFLAAFRIHHLPKSAEVTPADGGQHLVKQFMVPGHLVVKPGEPCHLVDYLMGREHLKHQEIKALASEVMLDGPVGQGNDWVLLYLAKDV